MKYTVKDSVFTYLFRQPEYTRALYLTLHPEDADVREDEIKIVTLENVLAYGIYNDLGIQIRDKLLILTEAQSTFSFNITLRMLMYLANTYKEYVEEHMLDLYAASPVAIPRPELYVIYSGSRADVPEVLRLSQLWQGAGGVDLAVKVLRDDGTRNIVDQYVQFCQVADAQREKYGRTQEALEETIRICLERNILAPFLHARQKEVVEIMSMLFDQETVTKIREYNIAKQARGEGRAEGRAEGRVEGRAEERNEGLRAMVSTLRSLSLCKEEVIQKLSHAYQLIPDEARKYTERYWNQ